jgi:hypothetical protein
MYNASIKPVWRALPLVAVALVAALAAPADAGPETAPAAKGLVVHEWGTFTTVAGDDGLALDWRPLAGESDLPSFVYASGGTPSHGLRHGAACATCKHIGCMCGDRCAPVDGRCKCKGCTVASVRMETPVIYFYAPKEMVVDVGVSFPKGQVTEWYPRARSVGTETEGGIHWGGVRVMPGKSVALPQEAGESHYYPARETDADPIAVCATADGKREFEKFLFYRGVGTFDVPVTVTQSASALEIASSAGPVTAIAFRRLDKSETIEYSVRCDVGAKPVSVTFDGIARDIDLVCRDLNKILVREGLYAREADAMIKTWRTDWFEPGTRVFYIVPRAETDRILPITLDPKPAELVRVMVGRIEVVTPEMERDVRGFLTMAASDVATTRAAGSAGLRAYGRFAEPILKRIAKRETDAAVLAQIERMLKEGIPRG